MDTRRQKILFLALLGLCGLITGFRLAAPEQFAIWMRVMPREHTATINNVEWKRLVSWDFRDGHFPDAWGWGDFEIENEELVLRDPQGDWTVYFTPLEHGGDFILDTEFQIEPGLVDGPGEAHLITRDSQNMNSECGLAVYVNDTHGFLRNTVRKEDQFWEIVDPRQHIDSERWHRARLQNHDGRVRAWVNGIEAESPFGN